MFLILRTHTFIWTSMIFLSAFVFGGTHLLPWEITQPSFFGGILPNGFQPDVYSNAIFYVSLTHLSEPHCQKLTDFEDVPSPRVNHHVFAARGGLYVYGGRDLDTNLILNDMYVFSFSDRSWTWINFKYSIPPCLELSSCKVVEPLVSFFGGRTPGGASGEAVCPNELWALNLNTNTWHRIEPLSSAAQSPPPIHSAGIAVTSDYVFIYGGIQNDGSVSAHSVWFSESSRGNPFDTAWLCMGGD